MHTRMDPENFRRLQADLHAGGYMAKDVTISPGRATVLGCLCALPFVLLFGVVYRLFFLERAHLLELGGVSFYLMFLAVIAVSVVLHELLHGIGWAIASRLGWKVVRFTVSAMMPNCACQAALSKKAYLCGVLAPFTVLGLGSILFVCAYPGTVSLLALMVNFVAAGADLLIALKVFREGPCLIVDHPTQAGYIAYYR